MNVAAAVGNALAAAIGAPIDELPMTPPRVLAAMRGSYAGFTLDHLRAPWATYPVGDLARQHSAGATSAT
jgi:hypothetical protein